MEPARDLFGQFLAALQFFIRLPLPDVLARRADHTAGLNHAAPLYGLVGLAIGVLPALVWLIAANFFPAPVAAGLAITTGIWLTGGLHEDGLADCADGLGGARTAEDALEIMKDSRVGAYGAMALVLSIGLRWAALATLTPVAGALALVIAHALARASLALPLRYSTYARRQGTGKLVAEGISNHECTIAMAVGFAVAFVFGGFGGLVAALAGILAATIALLGFEKRIGGYTGDALGGMEQATEIAVMAVLAALWAD